MKAFFFVTCSVLLATSAASPQDGAPLGKSPLFPRGDETTGRALFEQKQCFQCHRVAGQKFPAREITEGTVIPLGGLEHTGWTRDDFAAAIMSPQHVVAPAWQKAMIIVGARLEAETSPMPDFNRVLSVSELIDLVTFLEDNLARAPQ